MRACVYHHFHVSSAARNAKVVLVAPHHFSLKVLEKTNQRVTLLDKEQAEQLDERLVEDCNMVQRLLPPEKIKELESKKKKGELQKFVQAPNIPRKEVLDFISSLEKEEASKRTERQKARTLEQPPLPAPILESKPPGSHSILTLVDNVIVDLKERYLYLQSHEEDPSSAFLSNKIVVDSLHYLKFVKEHTAPIELTANAHLVLCTKEACSNVKILASIVNFTPLCDECMNEERVAR
jgi:hypothetical protein